MNNPTGKVVARFESGADPMSAEVVVTVEKILAAGQ